MKKSLILPVCLLALAGIILLFFHFANLENYGKFLPACPFFKLTGLYCPGCGATRAARAMAHGHFILAIRQNFLIPILLLNVLGIYFYPQIFLKQKALWLTLGLIFIFTLLRNLPWFPCTALAPTSVPY